MPRREQVLKWLSLLGAVLTVWGCEFLLPRQTLPPPILPPPQAAPQPPPRRPILYINASRVNLRACPGMDCPKIFALERNEEVEKVGESEDWSQVRVKRDGTMGWVASRFLSREPLGPEAAPPPLPPPVSQPPAPEPARPQWAPVPEGLPLPEKPRPPKPPEAAKPAEAAEPAPPAAKPARPPETPAPAKKPPPEEKAPAPAAPAPAEPAGEPQKRIRIM